MSTARFRTTKTSFPYLALLSSSKSRARHHFAWKIKSLATASTKFSVSSLTLNQSFPNPYKTSLLGVAFTRQETSNWRPKHRSLHRSQTKSSQQADDHNHNGMDYVVSDNFPKFSGRGSHEITNSSNYTLENGIMYTDIRAGKDENRIEMGRKFDIHYKLFDEEKNKIYEDKNEFTLEDLGAGLREGIKGMKSDGRRLIIVPPDLADHQHEKKRGYAIYDVTITNIHRDHWWKHVV